MKPSRSSAARAASYARSKPPISMAVDMGAFDQMVSELEDDVDAALRPAVQAGANVLYQAVLHNVDKLGRKTGNLRSSIYQAFVEKESEQTEKGYSKVTYNVSWNHRRAPHAHLIEYGWIQRYEMGYENGKFFGPIVRPEKRGTPKPKRNASQAEKDAYWLPRVGGPVQQPARPFMRPAFYHQGEAAAAVERVFWERMRRDVRS